MIADVLRAYGLRLFLSIVRMIAITVSVLILSMRPADFTKLIATMVGTTARIITVAYFSFLLLL